MASIEQLESFVAVAQVGSVVAAAEKLGKTHGPVTLAIQSLEARWGRLFVENTAKRQLSEKGQALLPWAEAVVASYYELKNSAVQVSPSQVSIGIDSQLPQHWMKELLWSVMDLDIRCQFYLLPSDELIKAFNQQRLDWVVTLADLPWPETSNFFSIGHIESYLVTSSPQLDSFDGPLRLDSGLLLSLPQLSLSHPNRVDVPIYKRFDYPCPWQIRVSDYHLASAILAKVPSHLSSVLGNIDLTETMSVKDEPHLKAAWGVLVFWSDHLAKSELLEKLNDWAMHKSQQQEGQQ
ncbi:LysR family transcriptional regulator [Vibrio cionasavignyae]|uniref:LysR family transcriptional regulator n=1 Tax=Vibrio cionasavignyae TaxID=2910252 RepID=UPI003D098D81